MYPKLHKLPLEGRKPSIAVWRVSEGVARHLRGSDGAVEGGVF